MAMLNNQMVYIYIVHAYTHKSRTLGKGGQQSSHGYYIQVTSCPVRSSAPPTTLDFHFGRDKLKGKSRFNM